jgi:hypothetical protein
MDLFTKKVVLFFCHPATAYMYNLHFIFHFRPFTIPKCNRHAQPNEINRSRPYKNIPFARLFIWQAISQWILRAAEGRESDRVK